MKKTKLQKGLIEMPRQPFNPPFYATYNYRHSSNDWAGNLPKPVAESNCQDWIVTTNLEEPGKMKLYFTPIWEKFFDATIALRTKEQDPENEAWTIEYELEEELYRMDISELEPDFSYYIYHRSLMAIGDDPEFDDRECQIDFTYQGQFCQIYLS